MDGFVGGLMEGEGSYGVRKGGREILGLGRERDGFS